MVENDTPATPAKTGPVTAEPGPGAPSGATSPASTKPEPAEPVKGATGASRSTKDAIREEAGKVSHEAGERARGYAAQGKDKATDALDEVSRLMKGAADDVDDKFGEQYGRYAHSAAGAVSDFAETLRGKEVDELLDDARAFVRKSPALAVGIAAAVGFVAARVIRSGLDTRRDEA